MKPKNLDEIIKQVRVPVVAKACGVTPRAVYKWISNGHLPRTEYTGETKYAAKIASISAGKFTARNILDISKPK